MSGADADGWFSFLQARPYWRQHAIFLGESVWPEILCDSAPSSIVCNQILRSMWESSSLKYLRLWASSVCIEYSWKQRQLLSRRVWCWHSPYSVLNHAVPWFSWMMQLTIWYCAAANRCRYSMENELFWCWTTYAKCLSGSCFLNRMYSWEHQILYLAYKRNDMVLPHTYWGTTRTLLVEIVKVAQMMIFNIHCHVYSCRV